MRSGGEAGRSRGPRGASAHPMSFAHKTFEEFHVGDAATFSKTITEADILLFAAVSGDFYPLHVDAEYAKTSRFGRRVAHGMLTASLLSTTTGALLQVPGGIYVQQTLHFRKPVFVGDTLTARSEVTEIVPERRRLRVRATVTNERGELVLEGDGVIQKDDA
jgi:3-hydroxybutyryl-CoA dehydratase